MEQFGRFFTEFKSSATRIETLDIYTVEEERENLDLYLKGAPLPPARNQEWAANIRSCVAEGKYMGRVHIIDHTLTPYLQFEIDWYYAINGAAGEDIRFIHRENVPDLVYTDTWLFDEKTVLDLSYNTNGELLYVNHNEDPERLDQAIAAWREFHRRSFTLAELLATIRASELPIPGR
ncbi:DUF6879 family protein [Actinomadura harenae]|uniref:DUF6879 family protein n=1 Tax=Actinomadura harenae TaxID=2483351 RepID=UPI0013151429|nr:DUF6879 family protein [Actinomadura harenae]